MKPYGAHGNRPDITHPDAADVADHGLPTRHAGGHKRTNKRKVRRRIKRVARREARVLCHNED